MLKTITIAAALVALGSFATATAEAKSKQLPMCYITVATDVGDPVGVRAHEMAHCWGWTHPEVGKANEKVTKGYKSYGVPLLYRLKGDYPADRVEVEFQLSRDVLKICKGSAYGCSCGGLMEH